MSRGVCKYLVGSAVLVALVAVAGCSHYLVAEREPWRHEAELACLNSGAVKESPTRVRIAAISGPGACGIDFPLRVSALGEDTPLGYTDESLTPPGSVPDGAMPQHWPIQSSALPPPAASQYRPTPYGVPQQAAPDYAAPAYSPLPYGTAQQSAPMSLNPPGVPEPEADDDDGMATEPPPGYRAAPAGGAPTYQQPYPSSYPPPPANMPIGGEPVPLGSPAAPIAVASAGPVEVKPPATLACPIVSVLDQWISEAVQPAAQKWFRQPVVEIKQISSYSCRGMNGNPNAHISEHAFGNALDVAEFDLADGHRISVQYGWHGTPEEQGFLHDVQAAACGDFTTVLAPGANVYHYNHIHVDLMRHARGRHICEPSAISGEVAAARARARYAAQHYGDPGVTGSINRKRDRGALGYSDENDDRLPLALPGQD